MTRLLAAGFIAALALAGSTVAYARTSTAPQQCLTLTSTTALNTTTITRGLGLTPAEVRDVRARLSQYNSIRGFPGLDGLGLTDAQIATIKARIAAQVAKSSHPLGWPCAAFKHRTKTVAFVRALLVGNGFAAYSVTFYGSTPRQIQFSGTLNGVHYGGAVARSGVRQITVQLSSTSGGTTETFVTPFDA